MHPGNSISSPHERPHARDGGAMICVALAQEDDVEDFLAQARTRITSTPPEGIIWSCGEEHCDLFAATATKEALTPSQTAAVAPLPENFLELARCVGLHSDPARFALLYAILWRLRETPELLSIDSDPQIVRARDFAKSVRRDLHKMKAFVRFRRIVASDGDDALIAWFEPAHHIVAAVAPFFVKRFTNMRWSILCPRASAHWDGATLTIGPGSRRADAPTDDELENAWRVYYASIFNPARLNVKAMTAQMPKKYWRNLPEASLIAPLIRDAHARVQEMVAAAPTMPSRYAQAARPPHAPTLAAPGQTPEALAAQEAACTRCPLHLNATQVVGGEGGLEARVMIVGEQPGDREDLAGRPFVGPAGKLLDTALERAGVDRARCFVTNAVKHFKFEPRGKRRLHKTPSASEIDICRWWLDQERALVKPGLIVALGATAIRGVLGRSAPVSQLRGTFHALADGTQFFATVHPSSLLRLQDDSEKRLAWRAFLDDLEKVALWMRDDSLRPAL